MKIPLQLKRYLLAMNSSALDAGIHAVLLFCGMAGGHQLAGGIPAMSAAQLPWVFAIAFGRACLAYLDGHPVAGLLTEVETAAGDKLSPPRS